MSSDNAILTIAVIAAVAAIVSAGFTYYSIASFKETWVTGFATDIGTANLTVTATASLNFTTDIINWGSGEVTSGTNASLDTSTGTVARGSWTPVSTPLTIENIGNTNVSLNISVGKTASQFLGGTNPTYEWNFTNNEAGSCYNLTQLSVFSNTATSEIAVCYPLEVANGADTLDIDLRLSVPSDSITGALGDIITANFSAI